MRRGRRRVTSNRNLKLRKAMDFTLAAAFNLNQKINKDETIEKKQDIRFYHVFCDVRSRENEVEI